MDTPPGLMCWHSPAAEGTKILYLKQGTLNWVPYNCSRLAVPDYPIHGGSRGFATMHRLLNRGWQIVPEAKMRGGYEPVRYDDAHTTVSE